MASAIKVGPRGDVEGAAIIRAAMPIHPESPFILTRIPYVAPAVALALCELDVDSASTLLVRELDGTLEFAGTPGELAASIAQLAERLALELAIPLTELDAHGASLSPRESDRWDEVCAQVLSHGA